MTSALQRVPGHRFAHIDALRGVAAAVVVWMHGSEVFVRMPGMDGRGAWLHDVADSVNLGRVGVVAFFLISGYVIPHSLQGPLGQGLRQFAIRRFFRLFPAFWLSIPLAYATVWMLWQRPFNPVDVLANITMLPVVFGREAALGLYWTLETELVFYCLVTLLFVLGVIRRPVVVAAIAFTLLAVFVLQASVVSWLPKPHVSQWAEMPFNLAIMLAGTLCRFASDDARRGGVSIAERRQADTLAVLAVLAVSAVAAAHIPFGRSVEAQIFGIANLVGIALFLATLLFWRRPPAAVVWMGSISYSLYLLHPVVLYPLAWVLTHHLVWPAPLGVGSLLVVLGVGSVALSALSYRRVELPAINLARRLTAAPAGRARTAWTTEQNGRP